MAGYGGISLAGLHVGDRVVLSGSVGGASTAASAKQFRDLVSQEKTLPDTPVIRVKDSITLLTGTCAVRKLD